MRDLIVCAAIKNRETGEIIISIRHFDKFAHQQIARHDDFESWKRAEQGFVNQRGEFLNREEALEIAKREKQIRRQVGGGENNSGLFSENLY